MMPGEWRSGNSFRQNELVAEHLGEIVDERPIVD